MDASFTNVAVAAGVVVPFVVSYLKSKSWSQETKHLLSLIVSVVFAVAVTGYDKGFSVDAWQNFVANAGVIFTAAQVFYTQFFQKTELNYSLESKKVL